MPAPKPTRASPADQAKAAAAPEGIAQGPAAAPPARVTIAPTIGRVVWLFNRVHQKEPELALICHVGVDAEGVPDGTVNLIAFDKDGHNFRERGVPMDPERMPSEGPWAEWMPYQRGQAPASSAVESRLAQLEATVQSLYSRLEAGGSDVSERS